MRERWVYRFLALGLLASASPALAEVGDKMTSVAGMWATTIVINIVAWLCGRKMPLMALPVLPVSALVAWGGISQFNDPWLGPAIREERGQRYIEQGYITMALGVLGPIALCAGLRFWRGGRNS